MVELTTPGGQATGKIMTDKTQRILCVSSYEKGQDFMRQCAEMGVKPTLLTVEKLRDAPWPREVLEDIAYVPNEISPQALQKTVCWMARGRIFDRIVALDEFDLDVVAQIREHTRMPGMGVTSTAYYRDKLAMHVPGQARRDSWCRSFVAC